MRADSSQPIDKIIQNLKNLIDPKGPFALPEAKKKLRWLETRAATICLEKLSPLQKSFDEELRKLPSNTATPTNSKDKEEDDGSEPNKLNQKNTFIKDLLTREQHEQLSCETEKLRRRFAKYDVLSGLLKPATLEKNDEEIRAAWEKVEASRRGFNNSSIGETLVASAELQKMRDPALESMRANISKLRKIGQKGYQRNFILKNILPALRERTWSVSTARTEAEIASHLYEFYYKDLAPLKKDIENESAEWKGWGGKTHTLLETFEENRKSLSQKDENIAELFYKQTFEKIVSDIKEILRKFTFEENPSFCLHLESEAASRNGGATGVTYLPSDDGAVKQIHRDLEIIEKSKLSYEEKISACYQSALMLKQTILKDYSNDYKNNNNDYLDRQKDKQDLLGGDKDFEQDKIHDENKMQKAFEEKFRPTFLSQNMKLANKISQAVDQGASQTAPNTIREIAQPIYRTLLTIEDCCVSYFKKRANSHWFKAIEGARKSIIDLGEGVSPLILLLNTYDAFLTAKIKMLDETIAQAEGRSKLFNSRSLALVNEIITLTGNEVEKLYHSQKIDISENSGYDNLRKKTIYQSNKSIEKTKEVNEKYSSFFFGIRKPKIDLKITLFSFGKN